MKYKINNNSGFTIFYTLLAFIIISTVIYVVVDSSSMLNNARIRAFMDEINGYKGEIIDFYLKRERWPGDFNGDGYFSWCGGAGCPTVRYYRLYTKNSEEYEIGMFDEPYNKLIPHTFVAPFIDLYLLRGGTIFKPNTNLYDKFVIGKTIPYVEALNNLYWHFYTFGNFFDSKDTIYSFLNNVPQNTIWFGSSTINGLNVRRYLKTFKIIDEKIDDGKYLTGKVRSYCSPLGCSKLFIMLTNNN